MKRIHVALILLLPFISSILFVYITPLTIVLSNTPIPTSISTMYRFRWFFVGRKVIVRAIFYGYAREVFGLLRYEGPCNYALCDFHASILGLKWEDEWWLARKYSPYGNLKRDSVTVIGVVKIMHLDYYHEKEVLYIDGQVVMINDNPLPNLIRSDRGFQID